MKIASGWFATLGCSYFSYTTLLSGSMCNPKSHRVRLWNADSRSNVQTRGDPFRLSLAILRLEEWRQLEKLDEAREDLQGASESEWNNSTLRKKKKMNTSFPRELNLIIYQCTTSTTKRTSSRKNSRWIIFQIIAVQCGIVLKFDKFPISLGGQISLFVLFFTVESFRWVGKPPCIPRVSWKMVGNDPKRGFAGGKRQNAGKRKCLSWNRNGRGWSRLTAEECRRNGSFNFIKAPIFRASRKIVLRLPVSRSLARLFRDSACTAQRRESFALRNFIGERVVPSPLPPSSGSAARAPRKKRPTINIRPILFNL